LNLPKTSIYLFLKTAVDKKNYRTVGPVSKRKLPDRREIYRTRSVGPVPISLTEKGCKKCIFIISLWI